LLQTSNFNLAYEYEEIGGNDATNIPTAGVGAHTQSAGTDTESELLVGWAAGGIGTYNLSGTGSIAIAGNSGSFNGLLVVGSAGGGTFNQSGGTVTLANGTSFGTAIIPALELGESSGSSGTYVLSGGSLTDTGVVTVGGTSSGAGGIGTFAVSGGSMSVTGGITVYSGSNFTQSGGTVSAGSMAISSGGTLNLSGGTLTAPITIAGTLATSASQTPINLTGSLTLQSTATMLVQRTGSETSFATVQENGNMSLAGVLDVYEDAANEATTTAGQSFIILQTTSGGILSGAFSNIASGQTLTTTDGSASFLVTVNDGRDGDVVLSDFQLVPEPGMIGVLGLGGIAMMRRRRPTSIT
jgi:hypothetical protein